MKIRVLLIGLAWVAAVLLRPGVLEAATYRLQVASVSERVFMYFAKNRTLRHMEAFLNDAKRSKFVVFRDRRPRPLDLPDQSTVVSRNIELPDRSDPWGVTAWEGEGGQMAVFRVQSKQSNHQRLKQVAVGASGALIRLPIRRIPASQEQPMAAPATEAGYLVQALAKGTFAEWADRRAASYDGLSVIVGRHHNRQQSDTVYLLMRMPPDGQSYKVVLGWETIRLRSGHKRGRGQHIGR